MRFHDRMDAGQRLAARLTEYAGRSEVLVLGLPRGGIPVAHEVATALGAPLDVLLVRKLGVPGHPELAMGAIASGGVEVLSPDLIRHLGIPDAVVEQVAVRERRELARREVLYRGTRPPVVIRDRTVIVVDDGLATGSTMEAAILALRHQAPARIVVAAPVGAPDTCARLARVADAVVCVSMPEPFNAVGLWYEEFAQTTDDEVKQLLAQYDALLEGIGDARVVLLDEATHGTHEFYRERAFITRRLIADTGGVGVATQSNGRQTTAVRVTVGDGSLTGDLGMRLRPLGLVLFAHGSGSSRHSSRNQRVARELERRDVATLLIDLLTPQEEAVDERTAQHRFDIPLLAGRLVTIIDWLGRRHDTALLPIGLCGASTGGGAALVAAADRPDRVAAVVSRGGRPDLAGAALRHVAAPTLLVVGGLDTPVIQMNRDAMTQMHAEVRLEIVPGATHLFEEPGTLDRVADLAGDWFTRYLPRSPSGSG